MQNFSASPREMVASLWRNKGLIRNLVHREVVGRYKGSMLGIFWSLATPIFMLAVYTFVFSVVFKARWGAGGSDSKTEFALVLFAGLMIFNLFSECVGRAPGLILANVNYVKKVVFPLEVLPWVSMGSALFHFVVSLGVWLVAQRLKVHTFFAPDYPGRQFSQQAADQFTLVSYCYPATKAASPGVTRIWHHLAVRYGNPTVGP